MYRSSGGEAFIGIVLAVIVAACMLGVVLLIPSSVDTYINSDSQKARMLEVAWESGGLHYKEGNANPIKVSGVVGKQDLKMTLRVKGDIDYWGKDTLEIHIPKEMLAKDGTEEFDAAKGAALYDTDKCEPPSFNDTSRDDPPYFKLLCRGGVIHLGETPVLVIVPYHSAKAYEGSFSADAVPTSPAMPPFRIDPVLKNPLPGEALQPDN